MHGNVDEVLDCIHDEASQEELEDRNDHPQEHLRKGNIPCDSAEWPG